MKGRVAIFWVAVVTACGHASLDRSETRGPHEDSVRVSDVPVRGAPVVVEWQCESARHRFCGLQGELIAVDEWFLYVAEHETLHPVTSVPREKVKDVTVELSPSAAGALGAWTAFGCASTVSHGFFLVFTGPLWLATGISSTVGESNESRAVAEQRDLGALYQYARFPQGMPGTRPPPAPSAVAVSPPRPLPPPPAPTVTAPPTRDLDGG